LNYSSFWSGVLVCAFAGCAYPMKAEVTVRAGSARDSSASSPNGAGKQVRALMIVPPSGSSRGDFEPFLYEFERAFLNKGLRIVSSAITGRVVQEGKSENAAQLSDLERALILAKETGADAVLQVGILELRGTQSRYFCGNAGEVVTDCTAAEFRNSDFGRDIEAGVVVFQGRLIDVKSGFVLAALDISASVADHLEAVMQSPENQAGRLKSSCSPCKSDGWWCRKCVDAKARAIEAIVEGLVRRVASQSTAVQVPILEPASPAEL
jgi:hypothetical protein